LKEFRLTVLPEFLKNVAIITAAVPSVLKDPSAQGVLWQALPRRFLLDVPDVARYLVEEGRRITIEPAARTNTDIVTRFVRMTPLAALLYQRGALALHAAVVANARGALLLAGDSGAGKSALLAALLQRGWLMVSDDLAVVDIDERGQVMVRPTFPEIALWPDSLEKLTPGSGPLPRHDSNRQLLSLPDQCATDARPLRAIYWLDVQNQDGITRDNLTGSSKFQAVSKLLYNSHIADALLERVAYMRFAGAIAQSLPVIRLHRPRGKWSVAGLADLIEQEAQ
jgi:hypothetical protein